MANLERTAMADGIAEATSDGASNMFTTTADDARADDGAHEPGATIGRYVVLERLGVGGMGVVYAAFDPELGRRVAIKLLHPQLARRRRERSDDARGRLLREAQALARLTHPNVITVHDVGTSGADVFIAMEFVDGAPLSSWLTAAPRSWRAIIGVFLDAARGLAAAHDAGLVHRDFKPDNVMIGVDGRVRVLDFGLARDAESGDPASSQLAAIEDDALRETLSSKISVHSHDLTRTGALMGTPAYMSPEQHMGAGAGPASDQFSLCVALYEALYGQRPFPADSPMRLAIAVLEGKVTPPPRGARAPGYYFRVLARGLSVEPRDRYPSMRELIAALSVDPVARRRRRLVAVGLGLGALTGALFYAQRQRALERACARAGAEIDAAWSDARQREIAGAFSADGREFARDSWPRVQRALERYAAAWREGVADSCRATRIEGGQSEDVASLRARCYGYHLEEFTALTEVLREASGNEVVRGLDAALGLGELDDCERVAALRASNQALDDPETLEAVESLRARLARSRALGLAGRPEEALVEVRALAEEVTSLGYEPLQAEVELELASRLFEHDSERAMTLLHTGLARAIATGQDEQAAWACEYLAAMHFNYHDESSEALLWGEQGLAWARRLTTSTYLEGKLHLTRARALSRLTRHDEARAEADLALGLFERAFGAESPNYAVALDKRGTIEWNAGADERARALREQALALLERIYGPDHPMLADSLHTLAISELRADHFERADALVRRGLELRRAQYGPRHRLVGELLTTLAEQQLRAGRFDEAIATNQESLEIFREAFGPDHGHVAAALGNLGSSLSAAGRHEEAAARLEEALAIDERNKWFQKMVVPLYSLGDTYREIADGRACAGDEEGARPIYERGVARLRRALELAREHYGEDHYFSGVSRSALGVALRKLGRLDEAEAMQRASLKSLEVAVGREHSTNAFPLVELGRLLLARGEAEEAAAQLERALALREGATTTPGDLAEVRSVLAVALWDLGRERARAHELATQAHAFYEQDPPQGRCHETRAWLADHPKPEP